MRRVNGVLVLEDEEQPAIAAAGFTTEAGSGPVFPVGNVQINTADISPETYLGYGTWARLGAGRMPVFFDANDSDFNAGKKTGGAKTVTLTAAQSGVPAHTHLTQRYPTATGGSSGFTIDTSMSGTLADNTLPTKANTAADAAEAHSNMPPFIVVYAYERTA